MQKLLALASLGCVAALATACGGAAQFRAAVPTRDEVRMRVPASSASALSVGEEADLYKQSVAIATGVNGGVLWVFDVIDAILKQPPTTADDTTAVWGPTEPRGLDRLSIQFTVVKLADDDFSYKLEARKKGDAGDFTEIFSGEAHPGSEPNRGTGTLTYHLGSLRSLDDSQCLEGDIDVQYDAASDPRTLDVTFHAFDDACNDPHPTDAHYTYVENSDKSGSMDFAFQANLHKPEENKPLEEVMSVRTRWLATGAGRSDVQVSGGEIPGDLAANGIDATTVEIAECWDDTFNLVYADTNPDELEPHLGHENTGDASQCAFADASFAQL